MLPACLMKELNVADEEVNHFEHNFPAYFQTKIEATRRMLTNVEATTDL